MSKKEQFNDGEIEDLFSKVEIPLEKDKNHIWSEKFESLVKEDVALVLKKNFCFSFILALWDRGLFCHTPGCHFLFRFPKYCFTTS